MEQLFGQLMSPGAAVGTIYLHTGAEPLSSSPDASLSPKEELVHFRQACRLAADQLRVLEDRALDQAGPQGAEIFHVHAMLLEDPDFLETAEQLIAAGHSARQAVLQTGQQFSAAFSAASDDIWRTRAADIEDVSARVADLLSGTADPPMPHTPVLLASHTLSPGELLRWGKERLLGLILCQGSPAGHTGILARSMGIPALTGISLPPSCHGLPAILDADAGQLCLDPDDLHLTRFSQSRQKAAQSSKQLRDLASLPSVTRGGRRVPLLANISTPEECADALLQGADGVGLFRSEFLFMNRPRLPDEEEQYRQYRRAVQLLAGRPLVLRTLDAGSDKPIPGLALPREENPALGRRGIRLSLDLPELFCSQLRAILRAAAWGPVSVMFPMVTHPEEVRRAKALLARCRAELTEEGHSSGPLDVGVMIETPAAALLADQLAQEVSFFSLGTNDLTQYTLAADRQHTDLTAARHPAVLSLIRMAAQAAHRHGCSVTVCGELAADPDMTARLLELGADALSVSPTALPALRQRIRSLD